MALTLALFDAKSLGLGKLLVGLVWARSWLGHVPSHGRFIPSLGVSYLTSFAVTASLMLIGNTWTSTSKARQESGNTANEAWP